MVKCPSVFTEEQYRQTRGYTNKSERVLEELIVLINTDTYLEEIPKTTAVVRYSLELKNKPELLDYFLKIADSLGVHPKDLMQHSFDKFIGKAVVNALQKSSGYKRKPLIDADGICRKIKLI